MSEPCNLYRVFSYNNVQPKHNTMKRIGFFAQLKGDTNSLLRFRWLDTDKFQIWVADQWEDADFNEFNILEVGQITADTNVQEKPIDHYGAFMLAQLGQEMGLYSKDLAYDDWWTGANHLYREFLNSEYNKDEMSEYDCIERFLEPKAKEANELRIKMLLEDVGLKIGDTVIVEAINDETGKAYGIGDTFEIKYVVEVGSDNSLYIGEDRNFLFHPQDVVKFEPYIYDIKISGTGTTEEIIRRLKQTVEGIEEATKENKDKEVAILDGASWENNTLLTEIKAT